MQYLCFRVCRLFHKNLFPVLNLKPFSQFVKTRAGKRTDFDFLKCSSWFVVDCVNWFHYTYQVVTGFPIGVRVRVKRGKQYWLLIIGTKSRDYRIQHGWRIKSRHSRYQLPHAMGEVQDASKFQIICVSSDEEVEAFTILGTNDVEGLADMIQE